MLDEITTTPQTRPNKPNQNKVENLKSTGDDTSNTLHNNTTNKFAIGCQPQGELVDRVEYHVELGRDFTENAKKELYTASVYASKARKVRFKFILLHS